MNDGACPSVAHDAGIIHRDLKSANIMVTRAGGLKVLDFGLSKYAVDETATMLSTEPLTASGMLVGTVPYMAPEVIEGHEADTRSDIFSLGIILFEMATGRRPFGGETPLATISSILRDASPLASDLNPAVPLELAQIIDGCLAKEPARRRQSASDLRADLENLATRLRSGERAKPPESSRLRSGQHLRVFRPEARRGRLIGAGAAVALLIMALTSAWNHLSFSGTVAPSVRSLAILPLEDLSGDPQQAYFSAGMTDALITNTARIDGLRVVPLVVVMKFQDTGRLPPAEVARELGVDAVLSGTIVRSGDRVRIAVNLIDPRLNSALWIESYERDVRDVLSLQNEVALAIAGELRVQLTPRDQARLTLRTRPVHPTAYDRYLRAVTLLQRVNRSETEAAISTLEEAVQLDPSFAEAFGALASAYWLMSTSYRPDEADRLKPKVQAAVDKALSLDPESAEALALQGDLLWDSAHGWRHEEAIQAHRKALALNSSLARSKSRLATLYNHVGLADLAVRQLAESDESPAVLFQKGLAFRIQGSDDLALASWLAIPPSSRNTNHLGHIAWILADLGRLEEAWNLLRQIPPGTVDVNGMLAAAESLLHAVAGERQGAENRIRAATLHAEATTESHHATYIVAAAYARIGNRDESLRWLRFTATNGFPCYPLMERDPSLALLSSYPPFVQFLDDSKTRWEGYRTRLGG